MKILSDADALAPFAQDYGRLSVRTPKLVAFPRNVAEVKEALRVARDRGLAIAPRSGGHGLEGQSLVRDGMVVATAEMTLPSGARIELDERAGRVRMVPSVRTGEIARFLEPLRLRLPSTTMDGFPAIGGAVSTAGIGQGSHRYGSLADQVIALGAVLGTGAELRVASRHESYADYDDEIASFILGGLGQAAIITDVALPVIPIRGTLRAFRTFHPSLDALTAALSTGEGDVAAMWGAIVKHPKTDALTYLTTVVRDVPDPAAGVALESAGDPGADPDVLPAWLDVICPSLAHAERLLAAHPELLTNLLTMPGMVLLIPQRKVCADRPTLNAWPKARVGDTMVALGVFYYLDRPRALGAIEALGDIRRDAIARFDAQPYFMDGVPSDWRAALGADRYAVLSRIRDRADPDHVFAR